MDPKTLPQEELRALSRHLDAAQGYLGLSLPMEAWDELEDIPARLRAMPVVLQLRMDVCRVLGKWELMAEIAAHLSKLQPDESSHFIDLAFAARRLRGESAALEILDNAKSRFPKNALIPYNLACYRAVGGQLDLAKQLLAEAFALDASLRATSLEDPDLVRVWDSL
jgi:hypothetical protein